jgi:hypothetical protein
VRRGRSVASNAVWLFAAAAGLLTLLLYREFILDGTAMLYGDDMVNEGFQLRSFGVEEIRRGRGFPMWNPFVYGGQPYLAILPGPVFYPSSLLYLVMPLHRAIGWTFVLHTFLSGLFAYFAGRSLRLDRVSASVAGLAFMLTGFVVSTLYGGHDGRMFAMTLIPLAFGLLERGLHSERPGWFLALGLVVALQIFTPHIQLMYYSSLALTLYAVLRIIQKGRERGDWRSTGRLAALWAVAFGAAALVGAAQLLPTVRILDVAVRGSGEAGYAFASSWALPPQEITALFLPDLIGSLGSYWGRNPFKLHSEYLGAVPIGLATVALASFRRDARVSLLAVTALVCLLFALGAATPVHRIAVHVLPFVGRFRAPSMMLGPMALMVALLAGVGWQRALEARDGEHAVPWRRILVILAPVLLLGAAAAVAPDGLLRWVRTTWYPTDWTRTASIPLTPGLRAGGAMLLLGVGGSVAAAWGVARKQVPTWIVAPLLLLLVADMWRVDSRYVRTVPLEAVFPSDPVVEHLQAELAVGERVFPPPGLSGYGPSELSVHGIPSVTGIQKFRLEWYERLTGGLGLQNLGTPAAISLLDVAFVVAGSGLTAEMLTAEAESERGTVYRVGDDLPHAFFPRTVEVISDTSAALRRLLDSDPREVAVVETGAPQAGEGTARIRSYSPNEIVLDVAATRPGLLFVSEVYYPAWEAEIDGLEAEVLRTNVAFRGVVVPEGRHELRLRYSAAEFRVGFAVSSLSTAVVLVCLLLGLVRPVRSADDVSPRPEEPAA